MPEVTCLLPLPIVRSPPIWMKCSAGLQTGAPSERSLLAGVGDRLSCGSPDPHPIVRQSLTPVPLVPSPCVPVSSVILTPCRAVSSSRSKASTGRVKPRRSSAWRRGLRAAARSPYCCASPAARPPATASARSCSTPALPPWRLWRRWPSCLPTAPRPSPRSFSRHSMRAASWSATAYRFH